MASRPCLAPGTERLRAAQRGRHMTMTLEIIPPLNDDPLAACPPWPTTYAASRSMITPMPSDDAIPFRRDDASTYSEANLDEIIKAVGELPPSPVRHGDLYSTVVRKEDNAPFVDRRAELRSMLNFIAAFHGRLFSMEQIMKFGCSPKAAHDQFKEFLRAVSDFESALAAATPYILPGPDGRSYVEFYGDSPSPPRPDCSMLRQGLAQARAWAEWNCSISLPRGPSEHGGRRARPPNHLCVIVSYLGTMYLHIFERAPGVSTVGKEVGGPFIRYLEACLRPLLGDMTPSRKALRQIWQRRRATMSDPLPP